MLKLNACYICMIIIGRMIANLEAIINLHYFFMTVMTHHKRLKGICLVNVQGKSKSKDQLGR